MLPETRLRLALAMIWLTPALWTVNFIIARRAPGVVDPHVLALGRWAIAGLILGLAARSELWRERQHLRASWPQYLVLGALGMLVCGAWVYLGARTTGAMNMALIYATSPVLISLGAVLWLGERMRRLQRLGRVRAAAEKMVQPVGLYRAPGCHVRGRLCGPVAVRALGTAFTAGARLERAGAAAGCDGGADTGRWRRFIPRWRPGAC